MTKFKPGDRVRLTDDHSATATVLAVHEGLCWILSDEHGWPFTDYDHAYELVPEPFLPNGDDCYCIVYANGVVSFPFPTLAEAESFTDAVDLGIFRIDGQTGELSWAKGGPNGVAS